MQLFKSRVISGKECKEAIMRGVNILSDVVESSLGPRSLNTGIARADQHGGVYDRVILKDGVNIAKAVELEDEGENFGAQVLLEAAQKSVMSVGDGTTVTISIARALIVEAEKRIAAGIHPMQIKDEIEPDIAHAVELLKKQAIPVKTLEQCIQVATVSCEEESLGKLIGETVFKIGDDGVISVDKSKTGVTHIDMQKGMQFDRGLASPYFQTDPDKQIGVIENGYVFVTDYELTNFLDLKPLLDEFIKTSRFLTIIAPDFGGDILISLIANKSNNIILTLAIKAPSFGSQQTNMLQDIAILTGATFITKEQGHKLNDVRTEHLGKAEMITATQNITTISGGKGKQELIDARIKEIKALLKDETNDFEIERLKERLAKMTNGVAVVKVGGATDIEIKERFERALDATLATRQAVKGGIVPGGEVSYLTLVPKMKSLIVKLALQAPFKRLITNAGLDSGEKLAELGQIRSDYVKKRDPSGVNIGYDVVSAQFRDMIGTGIIDPVNCLISALTNASSVAIQLISTKNLILPIIKEKK